MKPERHSSSKDDIDDCQLIQSIANGDKQAMSLFVGRHLESIIRFSMRYVDQRSEAEDVAQEAFTRVWTKAASWKPSGSPARNWLFSITYNLCIDIIRQRKVHSSIINEDQLVTFATPEKQLQILEKQRQLTLALKTLPERQCTAISLCHYQGFSNIDAANIMDISVEALESLLSRGRRKLRDLLLPTLGTIN